MLVIPPGVPHAVWNGAADEARAVVHLYPALETETLLETLWALGRAGHTDRRGIPALLQTAVLLHAYRREVRLAWPPPTAQRALVAVLASLGRLLGHPTHLAYDNQDGAEDAP